MERKIDGLVNQIYQEGIDKAQAEAEAITAAARTESNRLLESARAEAEALVRKARDEADTIRRNTTAELKLAAEQAVSQLRTRLQGVLGTGVLKAGVEGATLDADFLKQLILELARAWGADSSGGIAITLPEATKAQLGDRLAASLSKELTGLDVTFSSHVRAGFTVARKGDSYQIEFTDSALLEFFRDFLKPKTVELLFGSGS